MPDVTEQKGSVAAKVVITGLLVFMIMSGLFSVYFSYINGLQGYDFGQYYVASKMLLAGEPQNIYLIGDTWSAESREHGVRPFVNGGPPQGPSTNAYPPFMAIFMVPFTFLSFDAARSVFFFLNMFFVFVAMALIFGNRKKHRALIIALATGGFFVFPPFHFGQSMGQINIFLLLLLAIALCLMRRQKQIGAGAVVGLAAAIKLFPLAIALFFLAKRQYKAAAATVAVFVLLAVVSMAFFPPAFVYDYFRHYAIDNASAGTFYTNQGTTGFIASMFTKTDCSSPIVDNKDIADWLIPLASAAILGAAALFALRRGATTSRRCDIQYAAFIVALVAVLPKSWLHMAVFLLPAFYLAIEWLLEQKRFLAAPCIATMAALVTWTFIFAGYEYIRFPLTFLATLLWHVNFFATIALLVVLLWMTGKTPGRPDESGEREEHAPEEAFVKR